MKKRIMKLLALSSLLVMLLGSFTIPSAEVGDGGCGSIIIKGEQTEIPCRRVWCSYGGFYGCGSLGTGPTCEDPTSC